MKHLQLLIFLVVILVLTACDEKLVQGYSKLDKNTYYKIHTLGDGETKANKGDKLYAQIEIIDGEGTVLYNNSLQRGALHQYKVSESSSIWNRVFGVMHEGDSATFLVEPESFDIAKLTQGKIKSLEDQIMISVKLWKIVTDKDQNSKRIMTVEDDRELLELQMLDNYFQKEGIIANQLLVEGVYFQLLKRGSGKRAISGDNIWINYKGYFLDGSEFDNTYTRGQMLDFQLGKPDQVIRGFEIALSKMHEGDRVRLYIPSSYAFGADGSSDGRVPPFTTVIFELDLYKVN